MARDAFLNAVRSEGYPGKGKAAEVLRKKRDFGGRNGCKVTLAWQACGAAELWGNQFLFAYKNYKGGSLTNKLLHESCFPGLFPQPHSDTSTKIILSTRLQVLKNKIKANRISHVISTQPAANAELIVSQLRPFAWNMPHRQRGLRVLHNCTPSTYWQALCGPACSLTFQLWSPLLAPQEWNSSTQMMASHASWRGLGPRYEKSHLGW